MDDVLVCHSFELFVVVAKKKLMNFSKKENQKKLKAYSLSSFDDVKLRRTHTCYHQFLHYGNSRSQ